MSDQLIQIWCLHIQGLAAGLGIHAAIQSCPELQGNTVTVLGCPAEEGEAGKVKMIEQGHTIASDYEATAVAIHLHVSNYS